MRISKFIFFLKLKYHFNFFYFLFGLFKVFKNFHITTINCITNHIDIITLKNIKQLGHWRHCHIHWEISNSFSLNIISISFLFPLVYSKFFFFYNFHITTINYITNHIAIQLRKHLKSPTSVVQLVGDCWNFITSQVRVMVMTLNTISSKSQYL